MFANEDFIIAWESIKQETHDNLLCPIQKIIAFSSIKGKKKERETGRKQGI